MNDSYSQSISGGEKYKELCKRAMKRLIDDFGWEPAVAFFCCVYIPALILALWR